VVVLVFVVLFTSSAVAICRAQTAAAESAKATTTDRTDDIQQMRAKAIAFLKASQAEDGSFSAQLGPGVTALVTHALIRSGLSPSDPAVAKALEYVTKFVHEDGGIYGGESHQNYETSIALMCFHSANADGKYDKIIDDALKFERKIQWDADEQISEDDPRRGGQGYGSGKRPDMSNTGMFIDALEQLGTDDDDPALKEAIKFVSNSQNLNTPYNSTKFAPLVNDGGFYYTPAGDGESKAGQTENGGLRSYGSMTYVGFKSLLYAGLTENDPRVRAAKEWIADNYTLEENPGVEQQGLYYYYHVFGKALAALGSKTFTDSKGVAHDWCSELVDALAKRQNTDGSWVNPQDRWYEGDPNLVTAYSLLALSNCEE
jgi:squalene-hopene/tetraprenyl-beta-curcumene cyclase